MKCCISPRAVYVNEVGNRGITGIIGMETSHASIHVWDEGDAPYMLQMDVYSCKDFKTDDVLACVNDFDLVKHEAVRIDRNADIFKLVEGRLV